jgi:squalene synthase HpnC
MPVMENGFARELSRFGPNGSGKPLGLEEARWYCTRLARTHYENFTVASVLLPRRLQRHFHAIYAYCRWSDDLADETGGGSGALALLRWWRQELLNCYQGSVRHPVMIALRDTIHRFHIPPKPFLDLLFAFEQDQLVTHYRTFDQLLDYCKGSANPVGHLVLYLCQAHDPTRAGLADQICTGLQLANFWQDVARDLGIGRVYLPEEDRLAHEYPDADLYGRRFTPAFAKLMRFEVERTRDFFYRGMPLLEMVPAELKMDLELFVRGGLAILRKIERGRYNVWRRRPALAKWEKAAMVSGAVIRNYLSKRNP